MNREDIIRMAREASNNASALYEEDSDLVMLYLDELERFAALVLANNPPQSSMAWQEGYAAGAAAEREACAKVCEQIDTAAFGSERLAPNDCAAAIRARGNA